MLVSEKRHGGTLDPLDGRVAMVHGARLMPAIGHAHVRSLATEDGAEHAERELEREVQLGVGGVHQHVGAGLDLGHAIHAARDVVGARAAGTDDLAGEPRLLNDTNGREEAIQRLSRSRLALGSVLDGDGVPLVAHQAAQPHAIGRSDTLS